jgi:hypothetical protein
VSRFSYARNSRLRSPGWHARRRVIRGTNQAEGHGERAYRPVRATNRMITEAQRDRRRLELGDRDLRAAEYAAALGKQAAKRASQARAHAVHAAAPPRALETARLGPRRKWRPKDATGRVITGGARGFHLPQRGRSSFIAPAKRKGLTTTKKRRHS